MKLISKSREREWWLVKEWMTEAGLAARVHLCKWYLNDPDSDLSKELKSVFPAFTFSLHDHHTGYVQVPDGDENKYYDTDIVHGGVTFEDKLDDGGNRWVGFDLGHLDDEHIPNPELYAIHECESLAKTILEKQKKQ